MTPTESGKKASPEAMERAEKILKTLDDKERMWTYSQVDVELVAAALEAFAQERVKEALEKMSENGDVF